LEPLYSAPENVKISEREREREREKESKKRNERAENREFKL